MIRYLAFLFLIPLIFSQYVWCQWTLTEKNLVEIVDEDSIDKHSLKAQLASIKTQRSSLKEKFQYFWISQAQYENSNEKAIATFIPTFGPVYLYSTGIKKKLPKGIDIEANLFTNQQSTSNNSIDEATRTGVNLTLSMDIWKNIWGRLDEAELKELNLMEKRAELEYEVNSRIVELELRKLYWSIVANNEKILLSKGLLSTAEKQLKDGLKRKNQHIADEGDIARFKAQVASRKATLESLEFQRDLLYQSLKEQIPKISNQNIALGPYNTENKIIEVLVCSKRLEGQKATPWKSTKMDEILKLVEDAYTEQKIRSESHGGLNMKLESMVQVSGVDRDYSNSFRDFSENGQAGFKIGLVVSVPLGSTDKNTKESKLKSEFHQFQYKKSKLESQIKAKHTQITSLVKILQRSIKSLNENSTNLKKSIKTNERKFRQARISLNDLILQQDALMTSQLSEVDTKLQVIHTLMDYFQTFTEDPCTINKISKTQARKVGA